MNGKDGVAAELSRRYKKFVVSAGLDRIHGWQEPAVCNIEKGAKTELEGCFLAKGSRSPESARQRPDD